jgi:cellulose synthase/poly-beta-1,6-N-acetylglucosamine synthase-like glycosyltransferase
LSVLIVAVFAFGILLLAWVAYPLAMRLRRPALPQSDGSAAEPRIAMVMATRDAPAEVLRRIEDLEASDYPAALRRIIVAVDYRVTSQLAAYVAALHGRATVVRGDPPGGKASALNAGMREAADSDITVFADTGQRFDPAAISLMVRYLADSRFGGVTGRYTQRRNDGLMVAYAALEATVRAGQAAGHSVVSTSGSIYAMRTALWRPLPAGLICDDLFTTMSIVRQGRRVGFCSDAVAFDPRTFTREQQFVRRVRTLTGLIQFCMLQPAVLLPWHNPVWPHFVTHKLLRLATPVLLAVGLLALLVAGLMAAPLMMLAGLAGVAALVLLGLALFPARGARLWADLAWMLRLQLVPVLALRNGIQRRWEVWAPAEREEDVVVTGQKVGQTG